MYGEIEAHIRAEETKVIQTTQRFAEIMDGLRFSNMWGASSDLKRKIPEAFYKGMEYQEYLMTSHWESVRNECFAKYGRKCVVCSAEDHLQIHHARYDNKGTVFEAQDCYPLCSACHQKVEAFKCKFKNMVDAELTLTPEMGRDVLVCQVVAFIVWEAHVPGKNIQRTAAMLLKSLASHAHVEVANYAQTLTDTVSWVSKERR